PQSRSLFGSLDKTLGHRWRFEERELKAMLAECGLEVQVSYQMNKIGRPAWWLFGRVLGRRKLSKVMLKIFDKTVWFWKRAERVIPWKGLTLVVVARKPS
ncbi:MAG: glycosyl transferase, partial [Bryobacteraceae bacterium]|nr:glycosyl transferase [Bryobacteraceae bacterium]